MVFWDIEKLLKKLSSEKFTQKEFFSYLFGLTLLDTTFSAPLLSENSYLSSIFEWFDWACRIYQSRINKEKIGKRSYFPTIPKL